MTGRRDWLGTLLGIGVFLGGVVLLLSTFRLAQTMFDTPAANALGVQAGKAIDLQVAGTNLTGVILRILLLVVMAVVGSLLANRGISLYAAARPLPGPKVPAETTSPPA